MSKQEQVLRIEPQNELKFHGPFKVPVTSYMTLTNPSDKNVIFKIKTTAPKKYCVRPNSGMLEPLEKTKLAICLQPFAFDPSEKNKHKFMVQSLFAPDTDVNIEQLWRETSADQLMDSKLKCVFEMSPDANEAGEEPLKVSPKAAVPAAALAAPIIGIPNPVATSTHLETELRTATTEIQTLAEEASNLRAENLRLKEQLLHVRMEKRSTSSAGATKYQPAMPVSQADVLKQLVISVIVVIVGFILGKYVL